MTRLVAVIALVATTACGTTGAKHLGYYAGGAMVLGGTIGVGKAAGDSCDKAGCDADATFGLGFLIAGAVIIGIAAASHVDADPPSAPAVARTTPAPTSPSACRDRLACAVQR